MRDKKSTQNKYGKISGRCKIKASRDRRRTLASLRGSRSPSLENVTLIDKATFLIHETCTRRTDISIHRFFDRPSVKTISLSLSFCVSSHSRWTIVEPRVFPFAHFCPRGLFHVQLQRDLYVRLKILPAMFISKHLKCVGALPAKKLRKLSR